MSLIISQKPLNTPGAIGVFDSGFGGLTILKSIVEELPQYDYVYLGDNARVPYGTRSYETVYNYTLECLQHLFDKGCNLVIIACNTASAKALRTIQQNDLLKINPHKRVLGVIRPTAEALISKTKNNNIGIFATNGTVTSNTFPIELHKLKHSLNVYQQPCTLWVPLIEANEHNSKGGTYFVQKYYNELLAQNPNIDTIALACTHYPLLLQQLQKIVAPNIKIIAQSDIVAKSLNKYLQRHPEMQLQCTTSGTRQFFTTDDTASFNEKATLFYNNEIQSQHLAL
ncbi:MAG: glutamate racemase [Bacteroidia bacterium]|nr:glutamate racemase [Bacteroidia bacterium]